MYTDIDKVRGVVNALSLVLLANLFFSWLLGKAKLVTAHIVSHLLALSITVAILFVVEFGMVPRMGRHFSPLLYVHYLCLLGAILFGIAAVKRDGNRSLWHGYHGRRCLLFWTTAVVLGCILAN